MTQLKTLKDIEIMHRVRPNTDLTICVGESTAPIIVDEWNQRIVQPDDLRQAAIEWVKYINHYLQSGAWDTTITAHYRQKYIEQREWIMHFFNLTENDLSTPPQQQTANPSSSAKDAVGVDFPEGVPRANAVPSIYDIQTMCVCGHDAFIHFGGESARPQHCQREGCNCKQFSIGLEIYDESATITPEQVENLKKLSMEELFQTKVQGLIDARETSDKQLMEDMKKNRVKCDPSKYQWNVIKPLSETHPSLVGKSPYPLMRKAIDIKTLSVATQAMIERADTPIQLPYKELRVFDEEVIQLHTRDVQKIREVLKCQRPYIETEPCGVCYHCRALERLNL